MESNDESDVAMEPMDTSSAAISDLNASSFVAQSNAIDAAQPHGRNSNRRSDTAIGGSQTMLENFKYIENYSFPYLDDSRKYEKVKKIGHGTFGEVFKARERRSSRRFVAMKKVLIDNKDKDEGFPITALREIRILQLLNHENVVNLIEICYTKASAHNRYRPTFYLVFDFCEHDLAGLLANINVKFSLGEIKKVMQQLLNGLYYIHFNKVRQFVLSAKTGMCVFF